MFKLISSIGNAVPINTTNPILYTSGSTAGVYSHHLKLRLQPDGSGFCVSVPLIHMTENQF